MVGTLDLHIIVPLDVTEDDNSNPSQVLAHNTPNTADFRNREHPGPAAHYPLQADYQSNSSHTPADL